METVNVNKLLSDRDFDQFNHIPSVQHRLYIAEICRDLKKIKNISNICLCIIFDDHHKFFLSNMPAWAIHYHQLGGVRGDDVFNLTTYKEKDYFLPRSSQYDFIQKNLVKIEEQHYQHYDTYAILRKSSDCNFIFLALHDTPIIDAEKIYRASLAKFEDFCVYYLNKTLNIILEHNPVYKNAFIFSDKFYRKSIIKKSFQRDTEKLTSREIIVLKLSASGNIAKNIATLLNVSEKTVRNTLQNIREKLQVSTTGDAIKKAKDFGLI